MNPVNSRMKNSYDAYANSTNGNANLPKWWLTKLTNETHATLPETVKVGAMNYSVAVIDNMFADRSMFGEVTYGDQRIKIAGDVNWPRQINAFIHELTHAMLFEAGNWETTEDEEFVRKFSNMLTQVAVDNGWLTRGILRSKGVLHK